MLDSDEPKALEVGSDSTFTANGCAVGVNSTNKDAIEVSSGSCLTADQVRVSGGYNGSCFSTPPETGVNAPCEPPVYPPPLVPGGCDWVEREVEGTRTLDPGIYCDGLEIKSGAEVTLNPGLYIIKGDTFKINGADSVSGTGVTFYLTGGGGWDFDKPIEWTDSEITLSAPTAGPLKGLVIFQDPASRDEKEAVIGSEADVTIDGIMYFPRAKLKIGSESDITAWGIFTRMMEVGSESDVTINPNVLAGTGLSPRTALVE